MLSSHVELWEFFSNETLWLESDQDPSLWDQNSCGVPWHGCAGRAFWCSWRIYSTRRSASNGTLGFASSFFLFSKMSSSFGVYTLYILKKWFFGPGLSRYSKIVSSQMFDAESLGTYSEQERTGNSRAWGERRTADATRRFAELHGNARAPCGTFGFCPAALPMKNPMNNLVRSSQGHNSGVGIGLQTTRCRSQWMF